MGYTVHTVASQSNRHHSHIESDSISRPHFENGILLLGPFEQLKAVRKKKVDLRNSEQLLGVVFSTFCGQKFFQIFFLKIF